MHEQKPNSKVTNQTDEREQLVAILESTCDVVSFAAPDGQIKYMNVAGMKTLGWAVDEDIGSKKITDVHPSWATDIIIGEGLPTALRDGIWTGETALLSKDGIEIPVSQVIISHRTESGVLDYYSTIMRDITEHKQLEQQSQTNIHFFESLDQVNQAIQKADNVDQLLWNVVRATLNILECDRAWLLYPCNPDADTYRVPVEVTREGYPGACELNLEVPMKPGADEVCRSVLTADGSVSFGPQGDKPLYKEVTEQFGVQSQLITALYPKTGEPWMFGMHQCSHPRPWTWQERQLFEAIAQRIGDGLSSMLIHRQLQESERKLHAIFNQTFQFIGLLAVDGTVLEANRTALEFSGIEASDVIGKPFWETPWWAHSRQLQEKLRKSVKKATGGQFVRFEARHYSADGKCHDVDFSLKPVFDENDNIVLLIPEGRDITERKKAEEEIRILNKELEARVQQRTAELEAANRAKSDFLARMSHEIRTPLNAVTGLTNIVLKSDLTTEQRDYLNKVQLAGSSLLQVINDILDFSKVEAGQLDLEHNSFDLDQVMEQLADLFSEQIAQKDLELIFNVKTNVPRQLTGDGVRLAQVLINLIQNAVKFTESGKIVVGVEQNMQSTKEPVQGVFKFWVSDTGMGIAANELPTLFEPFTQAEGYLTRKQEGSGLGLAICRRLVKLMGGRIWAESTPGCGSTFYFTVMMETQKEEKPNLNLSADLRGVKTLVVDDSESARQVLVDQLESFDFNVTAVDSGEKAIKALQQVAQDEPFQVVVLDWKMPGLDGIETASRIRELEHQKSETANQEPQTPIIIMVTTNVHETLHKQIDKTTIDSLLVKPIKSSLLFNTIMDLFGQAEAIVPHRAQERAAHSLHRLAGRRVLVVEDSALNLDVAVALLEESGLTVETAENGQIAVEKVIVSTRGHYDAILMDIQMPVMDGYEATKKIREFEKQQDATAEQSETKTPIIALTAHALKGEKQKCLAAEMDDYLSKPLDEQDLHRVLLKWIAP